MIASSVTGKLRENWPDYVFNSAYHPMSLALLKSYIARHHHLPEIPSAGQVAKEGIDLGEMNRRLVKKVEELTLYLLDKDAAMIKQDERIRKLEQLTRKQSGTQ